MLKALQQTVRVGAGGKIELIAPECPEGADVQVIVLLVSPAELGAGLPTKALEVDKAESTIATIQAMVRRYVPEGQSLVDELIADRRAETARE